MYKAIGLMSGTSLDGIDLAYVEFQKGRQWQADLKAMHHHILLRKMEADIGPTAS